MLKPGQKIYAIASPMGFENSITEGLVSGIRTSAQTGETTIQFTAPVAPGSSGGGLFDEKGNLVGIIRSLTVGNAQNLNFAIPINRIIKLAEDALNNKPFQYSYYIKKGFEYYESKKDPQAHKAFMQAIDLVPADSAALRRTLHYYAGLCDYEMNNTRGAISHFLRAANCDTLRANCYYYLGASYGIEGDYTTAESYFEKALKGNSYNRQAYTSYAAVCVHEKKYEQAHDLLNKSFALEPGNTHGLTILASLYALEKNYAAAQKTCFEILDQYPDEANVMLMLSDIYKELNQPQKAAEWKNKAYNLNPALKREQ
jgi:tetratricopeptide (TPR) repeat protein